MRSTARIAALAVSVCAAGALTLVSASVAGQPVTQTLNPSPPAWQTCKAVGERTICEGKITESYGPIDTGLTCMGGFDIFDSGALDEVARRFYDENGNLVRRVRHQHYTFGQLTNPLTGATVNYTQTQTWTDVLAVPGDLGSATVTLTGEYIEFGADGAPVLIGAGRVVFAPNFTVEFQAGPSGFLDLLAGDPSAVGATCDALHGP